MKLFEEPADQQPSQAELREQFRAQHLADLRLKFGPQHPMGWNLILDDLGREWFTPEGWAKEMLRRLDAKVEQDFGLKAAPPTLGMRLEQQAQAAFKHDQVGWAEGTAGTIDSDAGPCDLARMSDDEICDYVSREIAKSGSPR